jgi:phage shock protein A
MLALIQENLTRQLRALELLSSLLKEEFADLRDRKPQDVSALEISVQELMRQLVAERKSLRRAINAWRPGMARVREVMMTLEPDEAKSLNELLHSLDRTEQVCAVQADMNRQLVMGLYDQSMKLLQSLQKAIDPGRSDMYSRRGRYAKVRQAQASVYNGRL